MSEEPLFDPSLKKRKKKAVAFTEDPLGPDADPTAPAPETIDNITTNGDTVDMGPATAHEQMKLNGAAGAKDDDFNAMFGDLKKKKKKKDIPMDFGEESAPAAAPSTTAAAASTGDDLDFSDMKKKKKSSKKKAAFDLEAFEKELNVSKAKSKDKDDDDDDDDGPDPGSIEIPEVEMDHNPFAQEDAPVGVDAGTEAWLKSDRDYTYQELLTRFYNSLHAANPSLLTTSRKRLMIAPPSLHREGNKRTVFANITDICKKMHRQPEHVISWLFAELGTTGSVDGSSRLVIKGKFNQSQIENVLKGYMKEYVTCSLCRSADTLLTKENRIFFMSCESCGSRRSVNAIRTGFQAQVGKRSKNKTG